MRRICGWAAVAALALVVVVGATAATPPSGVTSNGFETNTGGWFSFDGTITQRANGYVNPGGYASGINAADGSFFAGLNRGTCDTSNINPAGTAVNCAGPYTDWGNLNNYTWNGPYTTQVDIYLDTAYANAHPDTFGGNLDLVSGSSDSTQYGTRFDFTSAINSSTPDGSGNAQHLRDFGFNVSTGYAGDGCDGFMITGQTVVNRVNANPNINNYTPQCISTSGWYTFKHSFSSKDGYLDVLMQIFPKGSSTAVASWDITGIDADGTYGCNRYGWFSDQEIYGLPIDNAKITGGCATIPHVGQITPTGVTCSQYGAGTAPTLGEVVYTTKGNAIGSVSPGVFFYYTKFAGTAGQTVALTQTNNGTPSYSTIPVQQGQSFLYDASTCTKLKWSGTTLPSDGSFILGTKYDPGALKGSAPPVPATITYSFETTVGGTPVDTGATVDLGPK